MQLAREALCYALCISWLDDLCLGLFKFRNTDVLDIILFNIYFSSNYYSKARVEQVKKRASKARCFLTI